VSGLHGAGNQLVGGDFVAGVADLTALGMKYTGNASTSTFHAVSSVSNKTVDSNAIQVVGGAATHFTVSATGTQTAGNAFDVTVIALDANQNIAFDYPGEVHLSSTDAQAVLPSDYTFSDSDEGQHVFSVNLKTAPSQTVTVTDTSNAAVTGTSSAITVGPAALDHFQVRNASGNAIGLQTAGTAFALKITAQDQFGNTQTGFAGTVDVTSNRTISAGGGTTAAFTNGVLASHSVTLTQSGANSTVTVTKTGGTAAGTSNAFTVDSAALDHFTFSLTSPQTNGFAFTGANTLTAKDVFGNTVTSFDASLDTVTITANSPFVGAVSGLHGAGNELIGRDFVGSFSDLTSLVIT